MTASLLTYRLVKNQVSKNDLSDIVQEEKKCLG